ncbi:membrane protein [Rhodopirellula maiorica SM1]|uniref:Membrane protein n=1 Tax=Rhodopirellula maiorica SM1 TaxID=1265738 RepID=M5RNU0_9BACT|nr:hypothetical protein [Rhodopirellula maiorica]EMI20856.1 membrane protein [Rhodopirellula maiorica SM1]
MSNNPFPPNPYSPNPHAAGNFQGSGNAANVADAVSAPAISLIVVSLICIVCVLIALGADAFLVFSGIAERMRENNAGIDKETQITIRVIGALVIFAINSVILFAAIRMKSLRSYPLALTGAILAAIPCISPCYFIGIPFGIWAIVVLMRPEVKQAFH